MLTNTNNGNDMVMPVTPMGGGYNSGFGGFGNDGGWWILLLFIILFGGWGGGYGYGNGGGNAGTTIDVTNDVQRGFDQQATSATLAGINNTLNTGFANADVARCNMVQNLSNQMNNIAMNQIQNCNNTTQGIADLKYTVATEACADRSAVNDALRDVIAESTRNTQLVIDKLNQQEVDALKAENERLQTQINLAALNSSQQLQTQQLMANANENTQGILNSLNPAPVPAYVVPAPYGCNCGNNYGCGCGM